VQLAAQSQEVLAAQLVAEQGSGKVVDRAAAPAPAKAVPTARRGVIDMQARVAVDVKGTRHLAIARHFDAEQSQHVDHGRDR
jgi:hypothetical protein